MFIPFHEVVTELSNWLHSDLVTLRFCQGCNLAPILLGKRQIGLLTTHLELSTFSLVLLAVKIWITLNFTKSSDSHSWPTSIMKKV